MLTKEEVDINARTFAVGIVDDCAMKSISPKFRSDLEKLVIVAYKQGWIDRVRQENKEIDERIADEILKALGVEKKLDTSTE